MEKEAKENWEKVRMGNDWDNYFDYFHLRLPDGKVRCERFAKEGYERFQNDHRDLIEIKKEINNGF